MISHNYFSVPVREINFHDSKASSRRYHAANVYVPKRKNELLFLLLSVPMFCTSRVFLLNYFLRFLRKKHSLACMALILGNELLLCFRENITSFFRRRKKWENRNLTHRHRQRVLLMSMRDLLGNSLIDIWWRLLYLEMRKFQVVFMVVKDLEKLPNLYTYIFDEKVDLFTSK